MRAPLSVVIPTLNAGSVLPACLGALYEGVSAGVLRELIVVDGGSDDDTLEIADEAGANILRCSPSRGGQLRAGAEAAQGDWLLFVHADTLLEDGWTAAAQELFRDKAKAGYYLLAFDRGGKAGRVVAAWANLRSALFGLPYGDQGLLISRRLYNEIGGFDDVPLMEDVALARKLGRRRLTALNARAITSSEKYRSQGWLRRGWRNLWTLVCYFFGASPQRLAQNYNRT
ncbi:TIGR04283 family arsenosugar biosynthesis glycosyltransferase [Shimia sp.]|uniref:TIGR04283 family arsenosugar biosynthesis glycosyltransferase n=1 Tax=Shimia sp. TaxID=1954381 RepID=UPI003B8E1245